MKKTAYLSLLVLALLSCKKEKTQTTNAGETPGYVIPATAGSYWVYAISKVDSTGAETQLGDVDTVKLIGTDFFGGHLWLKYEGTYFGGSKMIWYERDSSGYIVGTGGGKKYSYSHTNTTLGTSSDGYVDYLARMSGTASVTVPAGTFNALKHELVVSKTDSSPMNNCGDQSVIFESYYADGVGLVQDHIAYLSELESQCAFRRRSLTTYYIAP